MAAATCTDPVSEVPYRLHFFELAIRGFNSKGENQTLHAELTAVRQEMTPSLNEVETFSVVPADCLLDLPAFTNPKELVEPIDPTPAADFLKSTYQMELRTKCQEERRRFVQVCREYLSKSFYARIRAAQRRMHFFFRRPKFAERPF